MLSKRYRCLQISKGSTEDYISYACRVNKSCVELELGRLSEEDFKSLVFVCGLKCESDAEVRTRLFSRIEERRDVTLEQLSTECQRLMNLRHDTAMIEGSASSVHPIRWYQQFSPKQESSSIAHQGNHRVHVGAGVLRPTSAQIAVVMATKRVIMSVRKSHPIVVILSGNLNALRWIRKL